MNPYQGFRAARLLLLVLLGAELLWLVAGKPISRWFRLAVVGVLVAAAVGYPNFGIFHVEWGPIHYWDAFHYFMGAKYLPELGYSRLYDATLVAGRELGALGSITDVRDQTTYGLRPASAIDPDVIRTRFSSERWESFKRDLAFFGPPIKNWNQLLVDHGYNDPPPRALLLHFLTRKLPANAITLALLTSVDYVSLIGAFGSVYWAFGGVPAAVAATLFFLNVLGRFDFIGGSILRWDWISALLIGVALLARGFGAAAGMLFGYSVLARIFPVFFLVPLAVKWVQARATGRRDRNLGRCLGAAAGLLVTVTAGLQVAGGTSALLADFVPKMRLHNQAVFTNAVGLGPLITFAMTPWGVSADGSIYVAHAAALTARPGPYTLPVVSVLYLVAALPLIFRARPIESMMYAVPLVFCGASLSSYYYSFLVLLVLLPWRDGGPDRTRLVEMPLLTAVMAVGYALELYSDALFPLLYYVSLILGAFFLVWIALEYARLSESDAARQPRT